MLGWVGLGWVQLSDPKKPKFWEVLRANVVWRAGAHFHTSRSRVVCDCLLQTECALRIGAFSRTNEVLQLWSSVGPISLSRLLVCANDLKANLKLETVRDLLLIHWNS